MSANINCRHVAKTGDIKDFVILEESGIAKGIRRVIAVTGHEAAEAKRVAEVFKTRLDDLEASSGKEKDSGLKAYTFVSLVVQRFPDKRVLNEVLQDLGQADISVIIKSELRDRLAAVRKAFDKQVKEREATASKAVCIL